MSLKASKSFCAKPNGKLMSVVFPSSGMRNFVHIHILHPKRFSYVKTRWILFRKPKAYKRVGSLMRVSHTSMNVNLFRICGNHNVKITCIRKLDKHSIFQLRYSFNEKLFYLNRSEFRLFLNYSDLNVSVSYDRKLMQPKYPLKPIKALWKLKANIMKAGGVMKRFKMHDPLLLITGCMTYNYMKLDSDIKYFTTRTAMIAAWKCY